MRKYTQYATVIAAAALLFIISHTLINYVALSSFSSAIIDLKIDHPDPVDIYYTSGTAFHERMRASAGTVEATGRQQLKINLGDSVVRRLRLDFGKSAGTVKLYSLELRSFFGDPIRFEHHQIYTLFAPQHDIESFTLDDQYVRIATRAGDPYIQYTGQPLKHQNQLLSLGMPALLALSSLLFLGNAQLSRFPAFADIQTKTSSIGANIGSLDGIRGLAALLVLMEHCGMLNGIGMLGVWLFFSLSGFLLAMPFVQHPERAVSLSYLKHFGVRRLKRILPMYYTFLVTTYLFGNNLPDFFRHILFLQGEGHLWTIPQEMLFYLVLPPLVLLMLYLQRLSKLAALLFVAFLIWWSDYRLTASTFSLYGYNSALTFKASVFLSGVLAAYAYHWFFQSNTLRRLDQTFLRMLTSLAGGLLLLVLCVLSARLIPGFERYDAFRNPMPYGVLSAIFLLLVVIGRQSVLSRVMGWLPLRAIGLVSFSFYLLHTKMLRFTQQLWLLLFDTVPGETAAFLVSGIITYLCASFTYSLIERPFLRPNSATAPAIEVQNQADHGETHTHENLITPASR